MTVEFKFTQDFRNVTQNYCRHVNTTNMYRQTPTVNCENKLLINV